MHLSCGVAGNGMGAAGTRGLYGRHQHVQGAVMKSHIGCTEVFMAAILLTFTIQLLNKRCACRLGWLAMALGPEAGDYMAVAHVQCAVIKSQAGCTDLFNI